MFRFFRHFHGRASTISSAAFIIGTASLGAKVLGVLRDRVLAGEFGAGRELDMYYAAFRIPDLIFNLLVLGTLSAGFIPVFHEYMKKGSNEAWQMVNALATVLFGGLVAACALFSLLTPVVMQILTPGFSNQELGITTQLSRIMFLSPILLGLSGIIGAILQSYKMFFINALAPLMYNIGIIIGALFLAPFFGLTGLAWGVVLGGMLHLCIQLPALLSLGFRPRILFDLRHPGVKQVFHLMIPRFLGLLVTQLNYIVITVIGSTLAAGSIAIFNFANNLQGVPLSLFAISYVVAAFPTLSELSGKPKEFVACFSSTLRQILFFIIPVSALMILLRAQIVRAVLGSGLFDWKDTLFTIYTLAFFTISLFAQSLIQLMVRSFYAQKDSYTPFFIGLFSDILNIVLSLLFIHEWHRLLNLPGFFRIKSLVATLPGSEVIALAAAFSLANVINLTVLWVVLRRRLGDLDEANIFRSVTKIGTAAFVMALVVQGLKYAIEPFFGTDTFLGIALQGVLAGGIGMCVYVLVCQIFRSPEAALFLTSFQKKFRKKFSPIEAVEDV